MKIYRLARIGTCANKIMSSVIVSGDQSKTRLNDEREKLKQLFLDREHFFAVQKPERFVICSERPGETMPPPDIQPKITGFCDLIVSQAGLNVLRETIPSDFIEIPIVVDDFAGRYFSVILERQNLLPKSDLDIPLLGSEKGKIVWRDGAPPALFRAAYTLAVTDVFVNAYKKHGLFGLEFEELEVVDAISAAAKPLKPSRIAARACTQKRGKLASGKNRGIGRSGKAMKP